jgi:hypothetical protein
VGARLLAALVPLTTSVVTLFVAQSAAMPAYAAGDFILTGAARCTNLTTGTRLVDWTLTSQASVDVVVISGISTLGYTSITTGAKVPPGGTLHAATDLNTPAPAGGYDQVGITIEVQRVDNPGYPIYIPASVNVAHACDFTGTASFESTCISNFDIFVLSDPSNVMAGPFQVRWDLGSQTLTLGPGQTGHVGLLAAQASRVDVLAAGRLIGTGSWHDPGCGAPPTNPGSAGGGSSGSANGSGGSGSTGSTKSGSRTGTGSSATAATEGTPATPSATPEESTVANAGPSIRTRTPAPTAVPAAAAPSASGPLTALSLSLALLVAAAILGGYVVRRRRTHSADRDTLTGSVD